ncbi:hypothetical protein BO78DRAFT_193172 [Aspergillus sclerotiicarbonarius CBS 121057]|uniref:Uncharacterized protein n=1 Tax=Aspergillus sclerotiicarbonarius (strain CBS 121057 / IBT 28362) TaxID=1448318 RepID=A0A319E2F6_ASPSB|nr:hypothetical protein BO78DRAFT_193172 [Aspergillus sclerotiicarbonarius CBS 121057]
MCSSAPAWISRHAVTPPDTPRPIMRHHPIVLMQRPSAITTIVKDRGSVMLFFKLVFQLLQPPTRTTHRVMFLGKKRSSRLRTLGKRLHHCTRNPLGAYPVGSLPTMGPHPEPGSLDCLDAHFQGISQHEWPPTSGSWLGLC